MADRAVSRAVWWCNTCGGHVGMPGSRGELCCDELHERVEDLWAPSDEASWVAYYQRQQRELEERQRQDVARRATPLVQRLRSSVVSRASDGWLSLRTPDVADVHDAADTIEWLLAIADILASSNTKGRSEAVSALGVLKARISGEPERFDVAAVRLFGPVRESLAARRQAWERDHGAVSDDNAELFFELPVVCVEHRRFVPCRTCMHHSPALLAYSDDPDDVAFVREHQAG